MNMHVIHTPSERNLADILTKSAVKQVLEALLPVLGRH